MQTSMVPFTFLCLQPASFVQKNHLAFWWCQINLPAVYSQRLEASGFSCFSFKPYTYNFETKSWWEGQPNAFDKSFDFNFKAFWFMGWMFYYIDQFYTQSFLIGLINTEPESSDQLGLT